MFSALLVEDDPIISQMVASSLTDRGYEVEPVSTGAAALAFVRSRQPDLVLLDLGLPDIKGDRVLVMIRALSRVPVIVVTAISDDDHVVDVLNLGADDYLVKPFTAQQLEARIRAVLRRTNDLPAGPPDDIWDFGSLRIDATRRRVTLAGSEVRLGPKEFDIMVYLARCDGLVTPRVAVLEHIWGDTGELAERRLDVNLATIRAKLGETGRNPRYLQSIRGVGLRLGPAEGH